MPLNTARNLQPVSRGRASLDGILLRGGTDGRGILAKPTYRILAEGKPG